MGIPRSHLAEVIAERSLRTTNLKKLSREIAAYLLVENRVNELESLIRDVLAYRQQHGVVEASAVMAHDLLGSIKTDVLALLRQHYPEAKHVTVDLEIDPEIIGGLKLRLANQQLDLSLRAKLDSFKRLTAGAAG